MKILSVVSFFLIYQYSFSQWRESKSIDQFSQIAFSGIITFSKDKSIGFFMEDKDNDPKLFVSHNEGQGWRLKRLFFNLQSGTSPKSLKYHKEGSLLFFSPSHVCRLDTSTLDIDTIFDIGANRTQPVQFPFRRPELFFFTEDTAFMLSNNLFRTVDGGKNWQRQNNFFVGAHFGFQFIDTLNGFFIGWETIYNNYKLFTTADGGKTWDSVGEPIQDMQPLTLVFTSKDTGFIGGTNSCVYKTTNRGQTWGKWFCLNDGQSFAPVTSIAFVTNKIGWITIKDRLKPFKTVDGGRTFFSQELPGPPPSSLNAVKIITPDLIFLTGSFLYRTTNQGGSPLLSIAEDELNENMANGITLYPNPANGSFKIKLENTDTKATVEVFDLAGRCVITNQPLLLNRDINISYLQSGTYLVKINMGSAFESRLLIKE
ncbi:MAG: T9SS type A sorting domain-containing protein [Bacteroidota bacterium]